MTRLAPSPTGALHLGNFRTFLVNWAMARQRGWRVAMRIEDIDSPRVKAGAEAQAIEDMRWLGIDWDGDIMRQSQDMTPYQDALDTLHARGVIYPCTCTRKDIEQAQSAPHEDDHELRYPGTCAARQSGSSSAERDARPRLMPIADARAGQSSPIAWRVTAPRQPVLFRDRFMGQQTVDVDATVGDFVVASKAGLPAYQLAVVVDDARQGVTDIIRGDDLIRSTGRQLWLYRLLNLGPPPRYWHMPLVIGEDGRRLAKRHGDTRLAYYRDQGTPAERVVGLLARWCGINPMNEPMTATAFADQFDIQRLPDRPVTFTAEDDAWLRGN